MEEPVFDTSNPTLLAATVRAIKEGANSFAFSHLDTKESLTDEDYALLEQGKYSELSIKKQYWINRYYNSARKAKDKEAANMKKMYDKPASIGQVSAFLFDMINGQGGVREDIERTLSLLRSYVAILGEALELKGLLTPDDLVAAKESLQKKGKAMAEEKAAAAEAPKEEILPSE